MKKSTKYIANFGL